MTASPACVHLLIAAVFLGAIVGLIERRASGAAPDAAGSRSTSPLTAEQREKIREEQQQEITAATEAIKENPRDIQAYSRRGDAYFFAGEFEKAVADYEKMVELNPDLDRSHWRRGIARFYAGEFQKAARQFEIYHTFDNVDRENGIWRFFSQAKAYGMKKARAGLLKYEKDDREPFPDVYRLFAGDITPEKILSRIEQAEISDDEREKRRFYAELYIGLNHVIEEKPEAAVPHLHKAVANRWAPSSSYGPRYMWHVGRVQYDLLTAEAKQDSGKPAQDKP